ncbi:RagB/SusD family nutrient uptake outer membrane protein [Halalkalibaculum sp. DA384]|uniref:RagB/SusD family nutrient uptake outer membrane protein n=1 Tax=Halalkalibaculum sp. DA384 TaxID=3373606 RepID=UPI0037543834
MKKLTTIVLLGVGLLTAVSCTEDLQLSPTSTITANSFWENEQDVQGGLNSMYQWFRPQAASNLYIWGGARSEEMSYGLQASEGLERYFENTIDANFAGPDWLRLYTTIYTANLALHEIPDIAFTSEDDKNRALARAHTMRAYVYFILARTWGNVPLVTEPIEGIQGEGSTGKPQADVSEIFQLIKQDLDTALDLFPDDSFPSCRCTWSRPAANALKGNVYLWTAKRMGGGESDLQTALTALQEVQSANVGLLDDFNDIFRYDNKGNQEILMAVHFEDLESGSMYNNLMYVRNDQIPQNVTQESDSLLGLGGGLNRWGPSETLRNQFTDDDSRKDASFVEVEEVAGNDTTLYATAVRKFRGFVNESGRNFMDDVILYRYADVLLMIAEAKNALGQDPSTEINQVRQRAYGDDYTDHVFSNGSQQANDEAILQERLRELAFEGKRWWDLVRFGKAFELVPSLQNRQGQDHLLLWPIPQSTLSLNGELEQNPGYTQD